MKIPDIAKGCHDGKKHCKGKDPFQKNAAYVDRRQDRHRKTDALYNPFVAADRHAALRKHIIDKKPGYHPCHHIDRAVHPHHTPVPCDQQAERHKYKDVDNIVEISPEHTKAGAYRLLIHIQKRHFNDQTGILLMFQQDITHTFSYPRHIQLLSFRFYFNFQ